MEEKTVSKEQCERNFCVNKFPYRKGKREDSKMLERGKIMFPTEK